MNLCLLLIKWVKILMKKSKNLSGRHSQKLLDHAKQSATDALEASSKKIILKNSRSNW